MPAKNPRLSVVLPPAVAATLAAISEETGESASSLVRGLLEQAAPALVRMLELVRAAKAAKGQIGAGLAGAMDRVVDDLEEALQTADTRLRQVTADMVEQAEVVRGRRRRGAGAAGGTAPAASSTPRAVTRGVGGTGPGVTKPRKSRAVGQRGR